MKEIYSIIIPMRNEEKNIKNTMQGLEKVLKLPHEIIIIDDHSTDNTFEIAKTFKDVKVISSPEEGQGITIMYGIKHCKTNIVVPITGDLSDDPNDIEKLVKILQEGFDVVCASRYSPKDNTIASEKLKRFLSRIVSFFCNKIIGVPTKDVTNSFRAYRKDIFKEIEIKTNGFATGMDIILQAHKKGFKITEIPTIWRNRVKGKSNFKIQEQWKYYLETFIRGL